MCQTINQNITKGLWSSNFFSPNTTGLKWKTSHDLRSLQDHKMGFYSQQYHRKKISNTTNPHVPLLMHKCKNLPWWKKYPLQGISKSTQKWHCLKSPSIFSETSQTEWCKLVNTVGKSKLPNSQYFGENVKFYSCLNKKHLSFAGALSQRTQNLTIISQEKHKIKQI